MEVYVLKKEVPVFCVTVKAFPLGIIEAFETLEKMHPSVCDRPFYGIFYQDQNGKTIYKAAVEEAYKGEGEQYGCETSVIAKGRYLTERIFNYMDNIDSIPEAFQRLCASAQSHSDLPCIEWYKSNREVVCMIQLKPGKNLN